MTINRNLAASTWSLLRELKADRRLWTGGLITSWFWLMGAVMVALLPPLIKDWIGGSENVYIVALLVFTVAIALGSALAGRASRMRPNLALVPLAALLMAVFALDLAWHVCAYRKAASLRGWSQMLRSWSGVGLVMAASKCRARDWISIYLEGRDGARAGREAQSPRLR